MNIRCADNDFLFLLFKKIEINRRVSGLRW